MSWWTDLASRAEDLLNRVDQSAAAALQSDRNSPSSQRPFSGEDSGWRQASEYRETMKTSTPSNETSYYYGGPSQKPQTRKSPPPGQRMQAQRSNTSPIRKKDDDAALLDFLNSSKARSKATSSERPRSAMSNKDSSSRRSSTSSTKSESIIDLSSFDETNPYKISSKRDDEKGSARTSEEQVASSVGGVGTNQESREPESFYSALRNDFSKTEIKRSSSVTPLAILEAEPVAPPQAKESPPLRVEETPPVMVTSVTTHDNSAHFLPDDYAHSDWAELDLVETSSVAMETPPMVDEMLQSSTVSEHGLYEAPPDVMTTSFQNPYADPAPSNPEPEPEPEPSRSPSPPPVTDEEMLALRQKVSSLELENKLLRSEVASLNLEIVAVVQREKAAKQDLAGLSDQLDQLNQLQTTVHELESREMDYRESLKAKDHQIGVLRVRLEEMDNEVAGKSQAICLLEGERERILRDQLDSVGAQNQTMENLRAKLSEAEACLRHEQDIHRQIQRESIERQTKADDDQRNLADQLQVLHKKLLDEKNKTVELNSLLRTEKQAADVARQELTDYKEKAARILQTKDKLIASLRDGGAISPDLTSSVPSMTSELEEVKQEREIYKEELQVMSMHMDRMRLDMADVESQLQTEHDQARDAITNLEEQLDAEKRKREECDQEILKQKQELRYAHEEILQQRVNFQKQLSDRETEMERLAGMLSSKLTNNTGQAELENRLRALTESLIQKQTMLENISTEKTSLTLQLERMERRFRDNETLRTQVPASSVTAHINMADDSDAMRNRLPLFLNETTYDTHVTRGMKRAASSLDAFSVRLGVFLRRYPIARIFVIMYIVLLHLWVSVVLLTYQPEVHGGDFSPNAPAAHHEH